MAMTEDQKKLLIGGGVGALALAVGFVIFGGKAAAAPAGVQLPQRGQPRFQPQRVSPRDHDRKRKKRRHDDGGERDERVANGRGEYVRKKHRRRHRGD